MNEEHKAKKGSPLEMSEWHTNLKKVNILPDFERVFLFYQKLFYAISTVILKEVNILPDLECVFLLYQKKIYADFRIFSRTYLSR